MTGAREAWEVVVKSKSTPAMKLPRGRQDAAVDPVAPRAAVSANGRIAYLQWHICHLVSSPLPSTLAHGIQLV
jgi:hypothetical protein